MNYAGLSRFLLNCNLVTLALARVFHNKLLFCFSQLPLWDLSVALLLLWVILFSFQGAAFQYLSISDLKTQSLKSWDPMSKHCLVGPSGLEPPTLRLSVVRSSQLSYGPIWWRLTGSNRWPPACKAGALPAELIPHVYLNSMVGLNGLEPTTSPLSGVRSNHLSYRPN